MASLGSYPADSAFHPGGPPFCLVCANPNLQPVLSIARVPVNCSTLWPSRDAACRCATGSIELLQCGRCGLTFNAEFDAQALGYDASYDNSLDFSPAFRAYAQELARELVSVYNLRNKRIVEIGCGSGAFLEQFAKLGNCSGIGYDPSYPLNRPPLSRVKFIRDYFNAANAVRDFDFLCCRHVLEHLSQPLEFLLDLAEISAGAPHSAMYFEVPNADFVLAGDGLWDVIYPHVSYFTAESLTNLFGRAGFSVLRTGKRFGDQYLSIEVRPAARLKQNERAKLQLLRQRGSSAGNVRSRIKAAADRWSHFIAGFVRNSVKPLALWGAGAKGVSFLNLVRDANLISAVVDSNPRKHGMFVPGTGQAIASPETLTTIQPGAVILLNLVYSKEIKHLMAAQGVSARLVTRPDQLM